MLAEESKKKILEGVDNNSATAGMAILIIDDDRSYWLRRIANDHTCTVLVRVLYEHKSALPSELMSLGFNAVGAGCAWVGTFAFSAAAPITGGVSTPLAYVSAAAAAAGTVQTVASGVRVYNELSGNHAANAAQDSDPYYMWTMRSCDVLQLVSAAGGARVAMKTAGNLKEAQVSFMKAWNSGKAGVGMNRDAAKRLAKVVGAERADVQGTVTAAAVKQQICGSIGSSLSGISSISGGVINEIAIGVIGTPNPHPTYKQEFVGPRR